MNKKEIAITLKRLNINPRLFIGNDTVVRCSKCGRTQGLLFKNGLKNGWSKCCGGYTMPIIFTTANIYKDTAEAIHDQIHEQASFEFKNCKEGIVIEV